MVSVILVRLDWQPGVKYFDFIGKAEMLTYSWECGGNHTMLDERNRKPAKNHYTQIND